MSPAAIERGLAFPSAQSEKPLSPNFIQTIYRGAKRWAVPFLGAGSLIAGACAPDAKAVSPTLTSEQPRPTAIAVGIGSVFVPTGNEEIDNIQKRLMDPTTKGQVPEEDILKFNEAIGKRAEGTATAEAQKPSATPEAKIVGNGAIMPAELSTTGVMREFEYQGQVYKLALYNLPNGTPIIAPKDDYFVARKAGAPFVGSDLSVFNPVDLKVPNIGLSGTLNVVNKLSRDVKKGEVIAYIQDTGEKMFGEYNFGVLITIENPTGTGFISPVAPYEEYLPNLPKGPRIVQTQPIQSSSGNVYLPKEK